MKIHYIKYLNCLITLSTVLVTLSVVKMFGFGFALNLGLFFKVFLILLIIFFILESRENRVKITLLARKKVKGARERILESSRLNQDKIASISPVFSGKIGKTLAIFFSYLSLIFYIFKVLVLNYYLLLIVFSYGIITELLSKESSLDFVVFFYLVFWVLIIQKFKLRGRISLFLAIFLLLLCPLLLNAGQNIIAEKVAYWVYLFFFVGVIKMIFEKRIQTSRYEPGLNTKSMS